MVSSVFQMVKRYFSPIDEEEIGHVSFFFRRCAQLGLAIFFATLFVPLKISVYEVSFFATGDSSPYQHFFLYFSDIFFLIGLLCIGLSLFFDASRARSLRWGNAPILFFWLALLTLGELSLVFSVDRVLSFLLVLRLIQGFLLYLLVIHEVLPLRTMFLILAFGLAGESVLGIAQYLNGGSVGLSFLGEAPLSTAISGVSTLTMSGQKILRAYGTFPHPNIFAAYLLVGFFAVKNLYMREPYRYGVIVVLLCLAFLVTFSRTAFFAGLVAYGIYYGMTKRRLGFKAMATLGLVLLLFLTSLNIGGFLLERMKFQDTQALQFRAENVTDGIRLLMSHPFGVGLGESSTALQSVVSEKLSPWEYQPAHNLFLVVSNELGLLGLALYLFLFGYILTQLYRRRRNSPQVFVLWVSVSILSLSDHYFFSLYHGWILFAVLVAIASYTLEESVSAA